MASRHKIDCRIRSKIVVGVTHKQAKVFDITFVIFDIHEIVIHLLVNVLEIVYLVALFHQPVQEGSSECAFEQASLEDCLSHNLSEELKHSFVVLELLAVAVWTQFSIELVLLEVGVLWVEYLVAELGYKLFEQTSTIDSFFCLAELVDKFDLQFVFQIEFLLIDFVIRVFKNCVSVD